MTVTSVQRRALRLASQRGGAVIAAPFGPVASRQISAQTARKLVDAGLVTVVESSRVVLVRGERSPAMSRVALVTKAGRSVLAGPVPEDPPVWLKQGDGLTTLRHRAVRGEEVVDPATLKGFWGEEAARRHAGSVDRRQRAREAAMRARRAA